MEDCGAVCVMTTGAPTMLKWSAENWDMEMMVRKHLTLKFTININIMHLQEFWHCQQLTLVRLWVLFTLAMYTALEMSLIC